MRDLTADQIKEIRTVLDSMMLRVNTFYHPRTGNEIENSIQAGNSLRMAKGWLGKILGFMGTDNPYKVVAEAKDIPPTQQVADHPYVAPIRGRLNGIDEELHYLNAMRNELKIMADLMDYTESTAFAIVWQHLHEASMNMGFMIQDLKDEADRKLHRINPNQK